MQTLCGIITERLEIKIWLDLFCWNFTCAMVKWSSFNILQSRFWTLMRFILHSIGQASSKGSQFIRAMCTRKLLNIVWYVWLCSVLPYLSVVGCSLLEHTHTHTWSISLLFPWPYLVERKSVKIQRTVCLPVKILYIRIALVIYDPRSTGYSPQNTPQ